MNPKIIGIIPARYSSSRFPGKPLALIEGVPMVVRVWQKAREALQEVYIATDHDEIYKSALKAGANAVMTSPALFTGTERVAQAAAGILVGKDPSDYIIINIQGDEPLISPSAIEALCGAFGSKKVDIATLIHRVYDHKSYLNPNRPKAVVDLAGKALYFSRSPIPGIREVSVSPGKIAVYLHIGVYAFRYPVLQKIVKLPPSPLETAESLEQLRWLENGYSIQCIETGYDGSGVDTPEDLEIIRDRLRKA